MKACPNCYLSFNDGYICPHCGGQLVDYSPEQPSGAYQAQQAQSGYYDRSAQSTQMMQSIPQQASYHQPQYQPQAQYSQPMNNFPPTVIKKRTGLVVFLTLLLLALAAFSGYLVYEEYIERTQPTEMDTQVVGSAWDWYTSVNGMFAQLQLLNPVQENPAAAALDRGASKRNQSANDDGSELASELDSNMVAEANATVSPGDGENTAAASASPSSSPTSAEDAASVHNSDVTSDAANAVGNAEAEALNDAEAGNTDALSTSMEALGESISELMGVTFALALITNEQYIQAVDGPMQALKEKYPDLVASWDGLKGAASGKLDTPEDIQYIAQKFTQAGESFKRIAETEGFDTSSW